MANFMMYIKDNTQFKIIGAWREELKPNSNSLFYKIFQNPKNTTYKIMRYYKAEKTDIDAPDGCITLRLITPRYRNGVDYIVKKEIADRLIKNAR